MPQVNVIFCDECGVLKREVNHWLSADECVVFKIGVADEFELKICGETCAHTRLSKWLTKQREQREGAKVLEVEKEEVT